MPDFKEELLQFIWRHRLLRPLPLRTVSGRKLTIIRQGELNRHSGPDFFNGQIKLDELTLAGNIELHVRSSDWLKHGHQSDRSYDHIILHVVYEHDRDIEQNASNAVEVLQLKEYIAPETIQRYEALSASRNHIPCGNQLGTVSDLNYLAWLERMTVERLETKTQRVSDLFSDFRGDYSQTFYCLLARGLGFNTNAEPFELLARQLPVHTLLKHGDNVEDLEALLLGFAGLLDIPFEDHYLRKLQNNFEFKRRKYGLIPLHQGLFKFSRMRPANFPTFRLAQLAAIIHHCPRLFSAPHHFVAYGELLEILRKAPSAYWQEKYLPDGRSSGGKKGTGRQSAEILMVNVFAPFFFFYAKKLDQAQLREAALTLLNDCAAENNIKTRLFDRKKHLHQSAGNTQGLIQLHDMYCSRKRCLHCGLAASFLKSA